MLAPLLLIATLPALLFASGKNEDFPLRVHVVGVGRGQMEGGVVVGPTWSLSYYWVLTVHIDGDTRELTMIPYRIRPVYLHLGDYAGRWNKNGSLEIEFQDKTGKLKHERFLLRGEKPLQREPPAAEKQLPK
jgi:hypothetical protein